MSIRRELGIVAVKIYTVPEVAKILRLHNQTIYNKISKGDPMPKFFRVGNKVRFRGFELITFIMDQLPESYGR